MKAFNFVTMREYGGSNANLVSNGDLPAFATFQQLKGIGQSVRKGAKSISIFCGYRKQIVDGKEVSKPISARVFDIIDTTASDDKEFLNYLKKEVKAGKLKASQIEVDTKIALATVAG